MIKHWTLYFKYNVTYKYQNTCNCTLHASQFQEESLRSLCLYIIIFLLYAVDLGTSWLNCHEYTSYSVCICNVAVEGTSGDLSLQHLFLIPMYLCTVTYTRLWNANTIIIYSTRARWFCSCESVLAFYKVYTYHSGSYSLMTTGILDGCKTIVKTRPTEAERCSFLLHNGQFLYVLRYIAYCSFWDNRCWRVLTHVSTMRLRIQIAAYGCILITYFAFALLRGSR